MPEPVVIQKAPAQLSYVPPGPPKKPRKYENKGFSPISTSFANQPWLMAYVRYLQEHKDSRLNSKTLDGIYWKRDNRSFLRFVFILSNGKIIREHGSVDYIKQKLRTSKFSLRK